MSRSPRRVNAVTAVEVGSDRDRVARALYEHDALRASVRWHPWELATMPKKLRYLDRAAVALMTVREDAIANIQMNPGPTFRGQASAYAAADGA
ncbi:hypothetical protein D3273_26850 [Lichenibacterium minor]|uniref:Uncharacterized protein n=1 Tax=Lichenibacterium minor TaxID=2316528 RepID=A0A4Q2TXQ7_9HYPH|nr:hypothetical protein [Lichenibacterium minor]RYC28892.1 hypothetical protein D3273_26850 [Lichenibacterium minor]